MELIDCRVVILKNDEQVRDSAKVTLVQEGFKDDNIFLAKDVEEAKEVINARQIDLVLTGIGVVGEEGPVLLKWIGEKGIREKMKVIFYSGAGEYYIRQKADEHGADAFLSLPVNRDIFAAIIKTVVETI